MSTRAGRETGWAGAAIAAALLSVLTGTGCGRDELSSSAERFLASPAPLIDFGPTALHQSKRTTLTIANEGRAPFTVYRIDSNVLSVQAELEEPFTLQAGDVREVGLVFTPEVEGALSGTVSIHTDTQAAGVDGIAERMVVGQGVDGVLSLGEDALSFGMVELLSAKIAELTIHNPSEIEVAYRVDFEGESASVFSSSLAGAEQKLAGGATVKLPVAFRPTQLGLARATAKVKLCPDCAAKVVSLEGEGVAGNLDFAPSRVAFGKVSVGATVTEVVRVTNLGTSALPFTTVALEGDPSVFSVQFSAPPQNALQPAASVDVAVTFAPQKTGPLSAVLKITADKVYNLPVSGEGGFGCLFVTPSALDFGVVPESMSATRDVTLGNRCSGELQVLSAEVAVTSGGYFSVASSASTWTVPVDGLTQLPVAFTPRQGSGKSAGTLSLQVREPSGARHTELITLAGEGRAFPDCSYSMKPVELDFGRVPVNNAVSLPVTFKNEGQSDCFVGSFRLAAGSDSAFRATALPSQVVAKGASVSLRVEFRPGAAGDYQALAEAQVSSSTNARPAISIRGKGEAGCLNYQPGTVDFGLNKLSCGPEDRAVVLSNGCGADLPIESVLLQSSSPDFTLDAPAASTFIPPGGRIFVNVRYAPQEDGEDAAAVKIVSDGQTWTLGLFGRGLAEPKQTDRFNQENQAKVDVLFVVDNSGSMMEEQSSLGQNFNAFMTQANASGVDYHVAITTTGIDASPGGWSVCPGGVEGGEGGRLFPANGSAQRIITPQTPNGAQLFAQNAMVGTCHWNEQGLEAAYRALSSPLANSVDDPRSALPGDGNAGFLRDDARLAIVFLSDEEDFSPQSVSFYETFFKAVKNNDPTMLTVSAIVGPSDLSSCTSASSAGLRYSAIANATGGVTESICTNNWSGSLQKLSSTAFGPKRRFVLSQKPADPSQISIQVNGVQVGAGWSYDPVANAIVFEETATPAAGSNIDVTYPLGC